MSTLQAINLKNPGSASNNVVLDASGNATVAGNLSFNSGYGSSAIGYGCRAWVTFNGTGTVSIIGSGNVSSISDNGTGDYTVNFTSSMPDTNYTFALGAAWFDTGSAQMSAGRRSNSTKTVSALALNTFNGLGTGFSMQDSPEVCVIVFR